MGAAIVAAVIASSITFYCLSWSRRRESEMAAKSNRHRHRTRGSPRAAAGSGYEKGSAYNEYAWEKYLPQSLDDRSIQTAMKTLFDQIQMHVENFYTVPTVNLTKDVAFGLAVMQTPFLVDPVATVLASARSPLPVIKHCLSYMIVQSVTGDCEPNFSLLLPQYAAVSRYQGARPDVAGTLFLGLDNREVH